MQCLFLCHQTERFQQSYITESGIKNLSRIQILVQLQFQETVENHAGGKKASINATVKQVSSITATAKQVSKGGTTSRSSMNLG